MPGENSQREQLRNLSNLALYIDRSENAEETYAHLTQGVCRHSSWDISSLQVLDLDAGLTIPIYRFDPFNVKAETDFPKWDASKSPAGVALEKGEPLILSDATDQDLFPGFRDDAKARGYKTTIIIPLEVKDEFDRPMVYTVASRASYEVSESDVQFLQCVAELGTIAIRKIRRLHHERREAERMRSILERMTVSLSKTLNRAAAESLAKGLSDLFPEGWLAVDLTTGRGLHDPEAILPFSNFSAHRVPDALISAATQSRDHIPETRTTIDIEERRVVAEVNALHIDGTHVGALFFFGAPQLSSHERIAAQAGQLALSAFILRGFVEFQARKVSAKQLISRLLSKDWRDREELIDEAGRLEFDLTTRLRMMVVQLPDGEPADDTLHSLLLRSAASILGPAISAPYGDRLVFLIGETRDKVSEAQRRQFLSRIAPLPRGGSTLVMSDACDDISKLPGIYEICRNTLDVAQSLGVSGWVTPVEIGEFPSLMTSADEGKIRTFLQSVLGRYYLARDAKSQRAMATMEAFLKSGRRYQETADTLGIHVSTLRYRLDQTSNQLDIEFSDSDKCFELEMALRLQKLVNSYDQ